MLDKRSWEYCGMVCIRGNIVGAQFGQMRMIVVLHAVA